MERLKCGKMQLNTFSTTINRTIGDIRTQTRDETSAIAGQSQIFFFFFTADFKLLFKKFSRAILFISAIIKSYPTSVLGFT